MDTLYIIFQWCSHAPPWGSARDQLSRQLYGGLHGGNIVRRGGPRDIWQRELIMSLPRRVNALSSSNILTTCLYCMNPRLSTVPTLYQDNFWLLSPAGLELLLLRILRDCLSLTAYCFASLVFCYWKENYLYPRVISVCWYGYLLVSARSHKQEDYSHNTLVI